ncbi:MAG: hypothetical protein HUJ55_07690 [Ileibacterium sp.]|nr:hypothetical protein [Ileibacterium sp.]
MKKAVKKLTELITNPDERLLGEDYGEALMYGVFGLTKTAAGILSGSPLVIFHGCYSLMNAGAERLNAKMVTHKDLESDKHNMIRSGLLITGMSVIYIICVLATRGNPNWDNYSGWFAWAMLLVQAAEIIWNIGCFIYYTRKPNLSYKISAVLSLANSCVGVVLIQTCLIYSSASAQNEMINIAAGIIMGIISAAMGIYLVMEGRKINV